MIPKQATGKAKSRSSFTVTFAGAEGLQPLEAHVLAVDLGTETFDGIGNSSHRTNTVIIWLEDDIKNEAMRAVRAWTDAGNSPFQLVIDIVDADEVKDKFIFEHAVIHALQHSIFTRENHDERVEVLDFRGVNKQYTGLIKRPVARETSAKLLQIAFGEMQHHIMDSIQ